MLFRSNISFDPFDCLSISRALLAPALDDLFGLKLKFLYIDGDFFYLIEQAPLHPASAVEVGDRDQYERKYPHGFWEGVDELEYQRCTISDYFLISDPFYSQNIQRSLYEFKWARI